MRKNNHKTLIRVLVLIIVIAGAGAAAVLTMQITPDQLATQDTPYPYTTSYQVSLPDGERVYIGSLDILAMQTGDRIALKIGDHREEMEMNETRQISPRVFSIRIFGTPVYDTGYQVNVTWTGVHKDRDTFKIVLRTNRRVPEWLMNRVIPGTIEAKPA